MRTDPIGLLRDVFSSCSKSHGLPSVPTISTKAIPSANHWIYGTEGDRGKTVYRFRPVTQARLPTLPHPEFDGKTQNGPYADVLAEIDLRAGQILDAIDDLQIRENTIVVWTSDNGPEEFAGWSGTVGASSQSVHSRRHKNEL